MDWKNVWACGAVALCAGYSLGEVNYSANFQGGEAGAEWSRRLVETAPWGGQRFLGQFGNESVSLTLPQVRAGELVRLSLDFLAIRTWDGNAGGGGPGPDIFTVSVDGGSVLVNSTFSVGDPMSRHRMSYPQAPGEGAFPSRKDAAAGNTLGFVYAPANVVLDATWRLDFTFVAPQDGLTVRFAGVGLQNIEDESWGLDNVDVASATVPGPGAFALAGCGGVVWMRRRRR